MVEKNSVNERFFLTKPQKCGEREREREREREYYQERRSYLKLLLSMEKGGTM